MAKSLCNFLPFCPTYRFEDGSIIRRSSRESISYEDNQKHFDIDLYYNGQNGYEYYLPPNLSDGDRRVLIPKVETYFRKKRFKIVKRGQRER